MIDALDGLTRLVARSPTLDGSVPLRVAQGCSPLLEGNAYGLQVSLRLAWRARRSFGRWRVAPVAARDTVERWGVTGPGPLDAQHGALDARARSVVATLVARAWLPRDGAWHRALGGVVSVADGGVVRVFTGLLVRPAEGCVLRVARCANRRSAAFDVLETLYADSARYTPLVIECTPASDARDFVIDGEVATLSVLPRGAAVARVALEEEPAVGRAHITFYDRAYFAQKRAGEVTRKYRKLLMADEGCVARAEPARVVDAGGAPFGEAPSARLAHVEGVTRGVAPIASVTFVNEVAFTARWDGRRVWLDWDRAALDARARAIEARWRAVYPEASTPEGEGALWYLTKYFTPHPPGEPHFFTKPSAFVVTPSGSSSLVEGVPGEGYDVLRGVVRTDRFHAAPAVFAFHAPGEARVEAGRPLVRVMPTPREMTAPRYAERPFAEVLPP